MVGNDTQCRPMITIYLISNHLTGSLDIVYDRQNTTDYDGSDMERSK